MPTTAALSIERAHEVGAPPGVEAPVLFLAAAGMGDALGVTDDEGPDPMGDGPVDDGLGGFMVGLADAATVPRLGVALLGAEFAPAATPALAPPWGFGAQVAGAGFGIGEMESFLGADRPPRHQQRLVVEGDCVRVDDPQIHASNSIRIHLRRLDRDRGGDIDDETFGVDEQRDRADLLDRIRQVAGETYP